MKQYQGTVVHSHPNSRPMLICVGVFHTWLPQKSNIGCEGVCVFACPCAIDVCNRHTIFCVWLCLCFFLYVRIPRAGFIIYNTSVSDWLPLCLSVRCGNLLPVTCTLGLSHVTCEPTSPPADRDLVQYRVGFSAVAPPEPPCSAGNGGEGPSTPPSRPSLKVSVVCGP